MEKSAISFRVSHRYSIVVSLVAIGLALAYAFLYKKHPTLSWPWHLRGDAAPKTLAVKAVYTALLCSCVFGAFNYYKFDREKFTGIRDYMDLVYYYTNSKYFAELGHFDLYPALLIADREGAGRMKNVRRYRDLRTYTFVPTQTAFHPERMEEIKGHFEPERWDAFTKDVDFLTRHYRNWSYVMMDRGYNPPATWTFVGGTLSRLTPIEKLKRITAIDVVLMALMFALVARAFGAAAMMFSLLWFTFTFSGRWPILGEPLLRFDWVATLVMSVCMLKLKRYSWAGGLMTYSMLSRVFPVLFFFPWLIYALRETVKQRRIPSEHLRFVMGGLAVLVLLVGGTMVQLGPHSFVETYENLKLHSESYSSHRVGLGDLLVFQSELTGGRLNADGTVMSKKDEVNALKGFTNAIGLIMIGLLSVYILRTKRPLHDLILLAVIPFYCVTVAQTNYYNLRLLLVVGHVADIGARRNQVGLILLFLVETLTQGVMVTGAERFTVTGFMSIGLFIYFVVYCAFLAQDFFAGRRREDADPTPEAAAEPNPITAAG
jgi:hypothetical protein